MHDALRIATLVVMTALSLMPGCANAGAMAPVGPSGQWRLSFSEDFDGETLDTRSWTTCFWWNDNGCTNLGNNELQWYRPENVAIKDGNLHLFAQRETVTGYKGRTYDYTSGMVTTGRNYDELPRASRFHFLYGHVEVKARVPRGKGLWSAIWLLAESRESRPEIDIMEVLGDSPTTLRMHNHFLEPSGQRGSIGKNKETADLSEGWHVYGLTWDPDRIIWYIDGQESWRYGVWDNISHEDMYLILNLAVGGDWPGAPTEDVAFPATFLIDYVRVWQRAE